MKKTHIALGAALIASASFLSGCVFASCKNAREEKRKERESKEHICSAVHDMKGPISAITGYASALLDKVVPEERIDSVISVIKSEGERLSHMVSDMLYTDAQGEYTFEKIDLLPIVKETMIVYENDFVRRGLEPVILSEDRAYFVSGDKKAIFRVISNLTENAVKYSSENSKITVTVEGDGKNTAITFYNEGCNLSHEDLPHVFKKRYRHQNASEKGYGLGLYTVKNIVKAHKGRISVSAKQNEFFKITVTLKNC